MAAVDDILNDEAQEGTDLQILAQAVTALQQSVADLKTQLAAALANATIPPDVQTKIDAAFAAADANKATVEGLLAQLNPTPPAPAPGT